MRHVSKSQDFVSFNICKMFFSHVQLLVLTQILVGNLQRKHQIVLLVSNTFLPEGYIWKINCLNEVV